jgi:[ribosomal protein S18]-alanine N-acetyltransferase
VTGPNATGKLIGEWAGWSVWRAASEEEDALIRLEAQSFGARSWGEKSLRESFTAPGVMVLLAGKARNAPDGFAIWRDLDGEAEILTLGVAFGQRRLGLGAALLAGIVCSARSIKVERLFLEVDAGNQAARALYDAAGFARTGVRRAYYRDGADAVAMQLIL